MPGITIFKRRWNIASDDLFFPGLIELIIRLFWMLPQIMFYTSYQEAFQCSEVTLLHVYFAGYLCIQAAIIVAQFFIVQISTRGTITNVAPRRHINQFLYLRTLLVFIEFAWSLIGAVWLSKTKWNVCSHIVYFGVLANIIFCMVAVLLLVIILIFIFDPISHLPDRDQVQRSHVLFNWLRKICCCCCFCCLYTGNSRSPTYENSYKQISSLLEHLFRGGNMTPSDVLAGIILKSRKEPDQYDREFIHFKKSQRGNGRSKLKTVDQIPKWMSVNEACYFVRYAVATYSWPFYLYMHNLRGFSDLCCSSTSYMCPCFCCCCCCDTAATATVSETTTTTTDTDGSEELSARLIIHGDVKSGRHLKAFKFLSKVKECDLIYANFENELFLSPFCVLVDHFKKCIIITIRGTLSMRDVITDMSADIGYFNVDHLTNQACHLGILKGSENVYDRIKSHNLLESAYRTNPNYTLLVTGHSLGAATATVLACKLKAEYPSVRCIAYSPPGGFISAELAEYTKSFVMSVIIGDDIVPRLSIISVHNLKADILKEIYSTSLPKYKIIWKYSMSFVSNDNQVVAAATTDSDEEGLSSIESITNSNNNNYNNKDDLDNSHNSNCLIDFDSANEGQLRDGQIIKQETGQTTVVTEITNVALTAITAIKSTAKSVISSATSTQVIEDEEFIMKQSIVGYTTARELMTKVYDSYVELELPGNILYIYQINPRNAGSRAGCLKWWQNSCASVFFCSKKSKKQMQYDSRWANNEEFKKILITNRMLMDHFPNNIQDALSYFNTTDRII